MERERVLKGTWCSLFYFLHAPQPLICTGQLCGHWNMQEWLHWAWTMWKLWRNYGKHNWKAWKHSLEDVWSKCKTNGAEALIPLFFYSSRGLSPSAGMSGVQHLLEPGRNDYDWNREQEIHGCAENETCLNNLKHTYVYTSKNHCLIHVAGQCQVSQIDCLPILNKPLQILPWDVEIETTSNPMHRHNFRNVEWAKEHHGEWSWWRAPFWSCAVSGRLGGVWTAVLWWKTHFHAKLSSVTTHQQFSEDTVVVTHWPQTDYYKFRTMRHYKSSGLIAVGPVYVKQQRLWNRRNCEGLRMSRRNRNPGDDLLADLMTWTSVGMGCC